MKKEENIFKLSNPQIFKLISANLLKHCHYLKCLFYSQNCLILHYEPF